MWVRYVLSGPPRYCYSRPRWLRKSMASRCTLSEFILSASQPDLRRALKSRSAPSRDSRWPHKGKQRPDGIAERDTYLIYRMWSDGGGVCVRLEMQSFAVVVVVVVSHHFPPGTPFGWHHLRCCKRNVMWNIQTHEWCLDLHWVHCYHWGKTFPLIQHRNISAFFIISSLDKYCTWHNWSFNWPDFTCFDCGVVLNMHFVDYTFSRNSWRRTSKWENGCIGANYCIVAWPWRRFSRRDSHRPQRWWCHRRLLAGGAAGGSFPRRSLFSCVVVEEMSSEQSPVWQLRVKWAEKSKSHPNCEHLIFTVARCRLGSAAKPLQTPPPPPPPHLLQNGLSLPLPQIYKQPLTP